MKALYGAVYKLKFELKKAGVLFKVAPLRARGRTRTAWDKASGRPLALPVPADVSQLVQKVPGVEVRLETWEYGTVGQILHLGDMSTRRPHPAPGRFHRRRPATRSPGHTKRSTDPHGCQGQADLHSLPCASRRWLERAGIRRK
jgi:hypothetical protein